MDTSSRKALVAPLALSAALLAGCTGAPPAEGQGAPSSPGSSPGEVDAAVLDAMDALLEAGATAVVVDVRDGDDHATAAVGTADGEREAEVGDPLRIASITKSMTAAVVLQLVDEEALALDTTVEEVLPGLLEAPAPITVEHLLNHTSGLPDYFELAVPDTNAYLEVASVGTKAEELLALAQSEPWGSAPGEAFSYANTNYVVLALLAEEITGQTLPHLLETRLFEPLGLDDTSYPTAAALPEGALRGSVTEGGVTTDTSDGSPELWGAGAAVISTVGDVSTFFQALFAGDVVSPESLALMQDVGAEGYGLGLLAGGDACGRPDLVFGQRGNGVGYRAMAFGSPDGERFVTVGWTGGTFTPATDPTLALGNQTLVAALAATC